MSKLRFITASVLALGFMACKDTLVVDNLTDPDRDRALSKPADVESFIGSTYAQIQNATLGGSNEDLQTQMQVMGMENTSALANFAMGPRGAIPRTPIENTRNSTGSGGNYRDFQVLTRAARMATIGIAAIKRLVTLGTPGQDARARSFARFVEGVAYGNLAMAYDSAALLTENDDPQSIQPLASYQAVMAEALNELDSAITIARANPSSFPLPATWIAGHDPANATRIDTTAFFQLIRSYKARFRAGVGRTPAERAAADWNAIIADANTGITADFNIGANPASGWDVVWPIQAYATGPANWHQMSQFWMGMADSSGGYDAWLATAPADRQPFLVVTGDRRFPIGTTRALQNADILRPGYGTFSGFPYVRNRQAGEDQPGQPLQISMYDFYRSRVFFVAGRIGNYPIMTRAEIRLLAAEGYVRTGNIAAAIARIDSSRTANGQLPGLAVAGITDTVTSLPGGVACVPRVPDAAAVAGAYKASRCGRLWDALKWEYRLETMYTGYGMWYFAGRGWGDLPEGTALYFPVPYQEMDTRRQVFYSAGGVGGTGAAPRGNYGLFAGGVY
jgi:hypothetical protein